MLVGWWWWWGDVDTCPPASPTSPFDVSSSHPRLLAGADSLLSLFSTSSTAFQLPPQPPQFPCSPKLQSGEKP